MSDKKLEFRELQVEDLFLFLKIIDKLGVNEFQECFNVSNKVVELKSKDGKITDDSAIKIGVDVVTNILGKIISNFQQCKDELYEFISALCGKEVEEIAKLSLWKVSAGLLEIAKDEDFQDFLKVASSLKN